MAGAGIAALAAVAGTGASPALAQQSGNSQDRNRWPGTVQQIQPIQPIRPMQPGFTPITPLQPIRPFQPSQQPYVRPFPALPGGLPLVGQVPPIRPNYNRDPDCPPGQVRLGVPLGPGMVLYPNPGSAVVDTSRWGQTLVPAGTTQYNLGHTVSVTTPGGGRVTFFNGYARVYTPGRTCLSPFGAVYGCQPYIVSSYVLTTGYPYAAFTEAAPIQPWSDADPYVTQAGPQRTAALRAALNDVTRFWEDEDFASLRRHLSPDLEVGVFQGERFSYALRREDFLALSSDALDAVSTVAFRFTDVRERNDGLVNAYARHTYRVRGESGTRTATVRYALAFVDGVWYVTSVTLPQQ